MRLGENKEEIDTEIKADGAELKEIETEKISEDSMSFLIKPMLRRFVLHNKTDQILTCQLMILKKSEGFLNFRMPASIINKTIKPKSFDCVLTLVRKVPDMAWGDYEVKCQIQLTDAPVQAKSDDDSGKKKPSFQIKQIDPSNAWEVEDRMNIEDDEEFFAEIF